MWQKGTEIIIPLPDGDASLRGTLAHRPVTRTRYIAAGNPLESVQKSLVSNLSDVLESKTLTIDERNLTSTQWVEYHNGTKRKSYNTLPASNITAEAVSVDGFTLSQTDNAGVTTTAGRSYTASGMIQTRTDGRGNTSTTVTDTAGRTLTVTDAAGNVTTTAYDSAHDLPATVTDAQGHTSCYRYDVRGRPTARYTSRRCRTWTCRPHHPHARPRRSPQHVSLALLLLTGIKPGGVHLLQSIHGSQPFEKKGISFLL